MVKWQSGLVAIVSVQLFMAQAPAAPTNLRINPAPVTQLFPMSWNDPVFANVANSSPLSLNNQNASNRSITTIGSAASVQCTSCTIDHIRIDAAEGVRASGGDMTAEWMWIQATGVPGDHADGWQCYGSGGNITVRNTTFRMPGAANATAGFFAADNWTGVHTFDHVLFWGGPYGLRLNVDGGRSASLNHVYFVTGSFTYAAFLIDIPITSWQNVYWATIVNGKLVVGNPIPRP
jgi:hypothetical protein